MHLFFESNFIAKYYKQDTVELLNTVELHEFTNKSKCICFSNNF